MPFNVTIYLCGFSDLDQFRNHWGSPIISSGRHVAEIMRENRHQVIIFGLTQVQLSNSTLAQKFGYKKTMWPWIKVVIVA